MQYDANHMDGKSKNEKVQNYLSEKNGKKIEFLNKKLGKKILETSSRNSEYQKKIQR
jgi:hypothetical protein